MAGGKESPRQKMIGMMYLVLTALLALNVSKQIVAAFVTINDKLESSNVIINNNTGAIYTGFSQKRAALNAMRADTKKLDFWEARATQLKKQTSEIVGFLLSECNEMIKLSEGEDWIEKSDSIGNITALKPLMKITGMDNYDIPTSMFVGGNPESPNNRGMELREMIHNFRDSITIIMATYTEKEISYTFIPPISELELNTALKTANSIDTSKISQFYRALTIPEFIASHDHDAGLMPWSSVMFDHAPIVAAAALFTSLKLDIKNAEALSSEYMLAKVDAPLFNFNKIKPLPFASASYINQGDSLNLSVLIAAIDTNNMAQIRYGIDDSISSNWKTTSGGIPLDARTPGPHSVRGQIGVQQQGETIWKDWNFDYTVGKPMGVVSLPKLNVLYRGYPDNEVIGTASGFPQDRISLRGNNCRIVQRNGKYYAEPGSGRTASITVAARNDNGSSTNLGTMNFRVLALPRPNVYLGQIEEGSVVTKSRLCRESRLFPKYPPEVPLKATFRVVSYTVESSSAPRPVPGTGNTLNSNAKSIICNSAVGSTITITVELRDPSNKQQRKTISFKIR